MKIVMTQTAKHKGRCFSKDDQLTVDDDLGSYLCTCGWAKRLDGAQPASIEPPIKVTLDVHNGKHGHKAQNA